MAELKLQQSVSSDKQFDQTANRSTEIQPWIVNKLQRYSPPLEMTSVEVYGKTRRTYQNAHPSLRELFTQNLSDETFLVFDKERYSFEVGATLFCVNSVDENQLRHFLSGRLAKFKIPRYFNFTDAALPCTASGKIFKLEIHNQGLKKFLDKQH